MYRPGAFIGVAFGIALGGAASAQTPVQQQPRDPNMPAVQNTLPEKIEGRKVDSTGSVGTLSDRLEVSDGVIKPPANIAPDMTVRPPVADPGTTIVIPPAGTPGSSRPNADPR